MRLGKRRRPLFALLLAVLLLVAGSGLVRYELVRRGERLLKRWETSGLPGPRPTGRGPVLALSWPPRFRWNDLVWQEGDSLRAACRLVEIRVAPWPLLTGKLRVLGIQVEEARLACDLPLADWIVAALETLPRHRGLVPSPAPTDRHRLDFEIAPLRFDSSPLVFPRVSGWCGSGRAGSWEAAGTASTLSGRSVDLRVAGFGVAGTGEVVLDVDLGRGRSLSVRHETPISGAPRWSISGRDDGSLLFAVLPIGLGFREGSIEGMLDFQLSGTDPADIEGEIQIQDLRFSGEWLAGWNLTGLVCIGGQQVSLQDLVVERDAVRLVATTGFLFHPSTGRGSWSLGGDWEGDRLDAEGTIGSDRSGFSIGIGSLCRQGRRIGPGLLRLTIGSSGSGATAIRAADLRGEMRIGEGIVRLERGWATPDDPAVLDGVGVPVHLLQPWLPFPLPGRWSGSLDAEATLHRSAGRWHGAGTALLQHGRVEGLALIEEVGGRFGGERGRGGIPINRMRTVWTFDAARLFADSLEVETGTIRIAGSVLYAKPDSIFGLLRVTATRDRTVASILRLLGGSEDAIDLAIFGAASKPQLLPLDAPGRMRRLEEIARIRGSLKG